MDEYQKANLKSLLLALDAHPKLKAVCNTGDWFHELLHGLQSGLSPNKSPAELLARFNEVCGAGARVAPLALRDDEPILEGPDDED